MNSKVDTGSVIEDQSNSAVKAIYSPPKLTVLNSQNTASDGSSDTGVLDGGSDPGS